MAKSCKICHVPALELNSTGRCPGCAAAKAATDARTTYGKFVAWQHAKEQGWQLPQLEPLPVAPEGPHLGPKDPKSQENPRLPDLCQLRGRVSQDPQYTAVLLPGLPAGKPSDQRKGKRPGEIPETGATVLRGLRKAPAGRNAPDKNHLFRGVPNCPAQPESPGRCKETAGKGGGKAWLKTHIWPSRSKSGWSASRRA